MNAAQNIALAFLVSQSATETAAILPPVKVSGGKQNAPKSGRRLISVAASNGSASPASSETSILSAVSAPVNSLPAQTAEPFPAIGSLTAEQFLFTVRSAKTRDQTIRAIAGFIGYNSADNFGSQEQNARMVAARMTTKRPTNLGIDRQTQRTADLSAKGFIAGMPDYLTKRLSDLQGREVVATENMLAHQKAASDLTLSEDERTLEAGLAEVESERLGAIRSDMARLSF